MDECTHKEICCCNAARAFAMFGLAIAQSIPNFRDRTRTTQEIYGDNKLEPNPQFISLPAGYEFVEMPLQRRAALTEAMRIGQVTSIVPNAQPLEWLQVKGNYGTVRCVYGVWLERKASFYGKLDFPAKADYTPPDITMPNTDAELLETQDDA